MIFIKFFSLCFGPLSQNPSSVSVLFYHPTPCRGTGSAHSIQERHYTHLSVGLMRLEAIQPVKMQRKYFSFAQRAEVCKWTISIKRIIYLEPFANATGTVRKARQTLPRLREGLFTAKQMKLRLVLNLLLKELVGLAL